MNQLANKLEHRIISDWIDTGASVLDLGCGDGDLLSLLINKKQVHSQGIDLSDQAIHNCIAQGLSVFQEDIDQGLSEYSNKLKNPTVSSEKHCEWARRPSLAFPIFCILQPGSKCSLKE